MGPAGPPGPGGGLPRHFFNCQECKLEHHIPIGCGDPGISVDNQDNLCLRGKEIYDQYQEMRQAIISGKLKYPEISNYEDYFWKT
jgi:hypothetical protein